MTMYLLSTVFRYYFNHRSKSTFWLTSTDLIDTISYKGSTIIVTIANLWFMKWSIPVHPHLGCFSGPQTVDHCGWFAVVGCFSDSGSQISVCLLW